MKTLKLAAAAAIFIGLGTGAVAQAGGSKHGHEDDNSMSQSQKVIIDNSKTIHQDVTKNYTTKNTVNNIDRSNSDNVTATGGKSSSSSYSQGGAASVNGVAGGSASVGDVQGGQGVGNVEVGGDTLTIKNRVAASSAIAPNVGNGGPCPEGVSIGFQIIAGGISGGKTSQNDKCMASQDARYMLGTGAATGDMALQAAGILAIDKLHKEQYGDTLETIQDNLGCADKFKSPLALTKKDACAPKP